ncbi:MAG: zinc ribbon domain-containing protein [Clostridia bacterium]
MPARFCGQCGTALKEDARFCPECGWKMISIDSKQNLDEKKNNAILKCEPEASTEKENITEDMTTHQMTGETRGYEIPAPESRSLEISDSSPQAHTMPEQMPYRPPVQPYYQVQQGVPPVQKQSPYVPTSQQAGSREFDPFHQNARSQSPVFAEDNKKSGSRMGLIAGGSIAVICLILLGFIAFSFIGNGFQIGNPFKKNLEEQGSSVNSNSVSEMPSGGKSQGSEIDGEWSIKVTTDAVLVNGKLSSQYAGMFGKSSKSSLVIDTEQGFATMKEPNSGIEVPLPIENKNGEITMGGGDDKNTLAYTGKLFPKGDGFVIEGKWESKNIEADMVMKGTFTAVKTIPILSQKIISAAVSPSVEELQGIYKGTLKYSKLTNLDKVPDKMMSAQEKEMMKEWLDVDMECTAEVDEDDIEISFVVPGFGESSMDDFDLADMKEGVLTICEIEEEGTATIQVAVLGTQGAYRLVGAAEMTMVLPDGDEAVFLMEFELNYSGPLE